jgi:Tol biopolymer transport system component/uncharacterized protein YjdB
MTLAALLALACGDDKGTGPEPVNPVPTSLAAVGTVPETAVVTTALAEPIRVRVLDAKGEALSGIEVSWSVVSGGGSLSATSSATNASGGASVTWTLGKTAGENEAKATVGALAPVAFKVRGEPDRPATLTLLVDGAAVDTLSFEMGDEGRQLTARVLDEHGNEVAAPTLEWSTSDTAVATVDTAGLVTARGPGTAKITASSEAASATATVRVQAPPPGTLSEVGDVPETATVGLPLAEPIRVRVLDAKGQPLSGAQVSWSVVSGGGSLSETSSTTDVSGEASVTWTLGKTAGENEAKATVGTLAPVVFKVRGEPGDPATLTLLSNGAAVDTLSFSAIGDSRQLAARVLDGHGNEITSPTLEWSTSDAAVATVDTTGLVTARGTGEVRIKATAGEAHTEATVSVRQVPVSLVIAAPERKSVGEGDTLRLTVVKVTDARGATIPDAHVSWTSADARVATVDSAGLVTAVREGEVRITAKSGGASASVMISVMGKIAFVRGVQIFIMNTDGSGLEKFTDDAGGRHTTPSWAPDGSKIAYAFRNIDGIGLTQIRTRTLDRQTQRFLSDGGGHDEGPVWSPDGETIVFGTYRNDEFRIRLMSADGSNQRMIGDSYGEAFSWSLDGTEILHTSVLNGYRRLFIMKADGSGIRPIGDGRPENRWDDIWPSLSPDGSALLFASNRSGKYQIYVMNLPYGQPRLLSDGSARDTSPSWSPDGSKVLFIREVDGVTTRVHVMNADGTGVVQLTSDASGLVEEFSPVWRPQPKR